jgi:enoyl-CoA hydratase
VLKHLSRSEVVIDHDFLKLGGGCELAMMCDIILASPTAKFGQPEINLGIIPAGGATQRLTHAIGKSRAMEIILTGRNFSAEEAEKWGLISRVVGEGEGVVVKEAIEIGKTIASKGQIAVQAAKETVNAGKFLDYARVHFSVLINCIAYELALREGLRLERRLFHGLFATQDQKEGVFAYHYCILLDQGRDLLH